jgi:hypothetical protein
MSLSTCPLCARYRSAPGSLHCGLLDGTGLGVCLKGEDEATVGWRRSLAFTQQDSDNNRK